MNAAIEIEATLDNVSEADVHNGVPYGVYTIKVQVKDGDGAPINGVAISMTVDGQTYNKKIDTVSELHGDDYYTKFDYVPQTEGDKTVAFVSEGLTKDLDVSVPNE